jgi:uncharacterized membrane protein
MTVKERLLQVLLYEVLALALVSPLYALVTGKGIESSLELLVIFSLVAMVWTFKFNWIFHKVVGCRSVTQVRRALHALGLELSMTAITLPITMAWMGFDLVTGIISSAGLTVAYCLYGYLFFFGYDKVRELLSREVFDSRGDLSYPE